MICSNRFYSWSPISTIAAATILPSSARRPRPRPRYIRAPGNHKSPKSLSILSRRIVNAYPACSSDGHGASTGLHPFQKKIVAAHQVGPIDGAIDSKRLAESRRPSGKVSIGGAGPMSPHQIDSLLRLQRSKKHGGRFPLSFGYHVEHPVHAIGEINVSVPGRSKHQMISRGLAPRSVACRVLLPNVGFHLDNPAGNVTSLNVANQPHSEKIGSNFKSGSSEKRPLWPHEAANDKVRGGGTPRMLQMPPLKSRCISGTLPFLGF